MSPAKIFHAAAELIQPARKAEREKQEKAARDTEAQRAIDFHWLMNSPNGRRIVWRLLGSCGYDGRIPIEPTAVSHYRIGRLDIALDLKAEINRREPLTWFIMEREAMDAANA